MGCSPSVPRSCRAAHISHTPHRGCFSLKVNICVFLKRRGYFSIPSHQLAIATEKRDDRIASIKKGGGFTRHDSAEASMVHVYEEYQAPVSNVS